MTVAPVSSRDDAFTAVENLDEFTPLGTSGPALLHGLDHAEFADDLRWLIWHAQRLSNYSVALELYESLHADALSRDDELVMAELHLWCGRFRHARELLEQLDRTELTTEELVRLLITLVRCCLHPPEHCDDTVLTACEQALEQARTLLRGLSWTLERVTRRSYQAVIDEGVALCLLRRGHTAAALAHIRDAHRADPDNPWICLVRGDIEQAAGNRAAAQQSWRRSVDAVHPESYLATALRSRMETIFR